MDYKLNNIIQELKTKKADLQAILEAWEAVTFPTKKDGAAFAVLSKNINGARITTEAYNIKGVEDSLEVFASRGYRYKIITGYFESKISLYYSLEPATKNEKWLTDTDKEMRARAEAKPQNVHKRGAYIKDAYVFDLEDIKEAIQKRIEYIKKGINQTTWDIENAEAIYSKYATAATKLFKELESETKAKGSTALYYAIRDMIRGIY